MPQISRFFGITISMYYDDHNPPHFHASYSGASAAISIRDFSVLEGALPSRTLGLVVEWASSHQQELLENWTRLENKEELKNVEPLQ